MHNIVEHLSSRQLSPPVVTGRTNARQRVIDAARSLLRQVGYDRFTLEAVAARSGLSRRTIYNQFENRDALYRATRLALLGAFEDDLPREIPADADLQGTIEAFCAAAIEVLSTPEHRELLASVQRDRAGAPWLADLYRARVDRPLRIAIEHYLLMQKAFGALEIADPAPHARSLLATIRAAVSASDTAPVFRPSELALLFAARLQNALRAV